MRTRRPITDDQELWRLAAQQVIKRLERRWADHLPFGSLPKGLAKQLVQSDGFEVLVQVQLRTGALPLPDLDFHPVVERRPDGTVRNLLDEELGGDPAEWYCADCSEELEAPSKEGRCPPCQHWRKTGVSSR